MTARKRALRVAANVMSRISRGRKLWIGLAVSLAAAAGAGFAAFNYLWAAFAMSRSSSGARAMDWAYIWSGVASLFAAVFIYYLVRLTIEAVRAQKAKQAR